MIIVLWKSHLGDLTCHPKFSVYVYICLLQIIWCEKVRIDKMLSSYANVQNDLHCILQRKFSPNIVYRGHTAFETAVTVLYCDHTHTMPIWIHTTARNVNIRMPPIVIVYWFSLIRTTYSCLCFLLLVIEICSNVINERSL